MKRFTVIVLLTALLVSSLGAAVGLSTVRKASSLLQALRPQTTIEMDGKKLILSKRSIPKLKRIFEEHDFSQLAYTERLELYTKAKVSLGQGVWRNVVFGFGEGSKYQGDVGGHLIGMIVDWSSLTAIGVGASLYIIDFFIMGMFAGDFKPNDPNNELNQIAIYTMAIGGGLLLANRIAQVIMPLIYGPRYNKQLGQGLGIAKDESDAFAVSVGILPTVEGSVRLAANIRF